MADLGLDAGTDLDAAPPATGAADGATTAAWGVIVAFALLVAVTQVLWLTYAPIDTDAARDLSVSVTAIGWLANIFPLVYLLVALPAGLALDRWFRPALGLGAGLALAGALVRLAAPSYTVALGGQLLGALAQPFVLGALTKIATGYLPPASRAAGIALGSAAQLIGSIAAFVLGPALQSHRSLTTLLVVEALLTALAVAALATGLVRRAPASAGPPAGAGRDELRVVWAVPLVRTLSVLTFIGVGVFGTVSTYLQPILSHSHISSSQAGLILAAMLVAGIIGCAVTPPLVARRGRERSYLTFTVVWVVAMLALLAIAHGSLVADFVLAAALGVVLLAALPVILELTERRLGASGGVATSVLLMTGNGGILVIAVVVGLFTGTAVLAFTLLAAATLLALPAAQRIRAGG